MAFGTDPNAPYGNVRASEVESSIYESAIKAIRISDIPSHLQMLLDYDTRTDGQPVYQGWGAQGLATSSSGWLIQNFTFNVSSQVTGRKTWFGSYDGRASGSYT